MRTAHAGDTRTPPPTTTVAVHTGGEGSDRGTGLRSAAGVHSPDDSTRLPADTQPQREQPSIGIRERPDERRYPQLRTARSST